MHNHQNVVAICSLLFSSSVIGGLEYPVELRYTGAEPLSSTPSWIKGDLVPILDPNAIGQPPSTCQSRGDGMKSGVLSFRRTVVAGMFHFLPFEKLC